MSMDPAYNPYTPVATDPTTYSGGLQPLKGFPKIVCIFFIILGAIGLLQSVGTVFSMGLNAVLAAQPGEKQINPIDFVPGGMIISILLAVINFAVSATELVAGVLGLKQKILGARLIRKVSAVMLLVKVVETAFGCFAGVYMIAPVKEQMAKQMQNNPNPPPFDPGVFVEVGVYVGIGFSILMGLAMFLFYLFSFLSFGKRETLAQFS